MIRNLENVFLGMLRVGVVLTAALLLLGAIVFGFGAIPALGSKDQPAPAPVSIGVEDVKAQLARKQDKPVKGAVEQPLDEARQTAIAADLEKIKVIITGYVEADGDLSVDQQKLHQFLLTQINSQGEAEQGIYAKTLARDLESLLKLPEVAEVEAVSGKFEAVDTALSGFHKAFAKKHDEQMEQAKMAEIKTAQEREQAVQNLYVAAGALGLFMLFAFLLVFIRVERNLREMAAKGGAV